MIERTYTTPFGTITYWVNQILVSAQGEKSDERPCLVLLSGLTADHRLFDKQVEFFENRYPILTWDAPGHAASRPFTFDFDLDDKARWLREILRAEGVKKFILVGQSMGGYVSQVFLELFPGETAGFISIDSAPLQRHYITSAEIWMLKHVEGMYLAYPHKALIRDGAWGCAETPYGRDLMKETWACYGHREYCKLAAHGFKMLARAYELNRAYAIDCPAMLICGAKDKAGSAKRYNLRWSRETGITFHLIPGAGHNANTDKPEEINKLIEDFVAGL